MSEANKTTVAAPTATPTTAAAAAPAAQAASIAELEAACPGAGGDFLVEQLKKGATLAQAQAAFIEYQQAQIRARDEELAKAKAPAAKDPKEPADDKKVEESAAATKRPGVKAVASKAAEQKGAGASANGGDDIAAEFEARVKTLTDGGMSRAKAAAQVFAADEDFRQAYIAAKSAK